MAFIMDQSSNMITSIAESDHSLFIDLIKKDDPSFKNMLDYLELCDFVTHLEKKVKRAQTKFNVYRIELTAELFKESIMTSNDATLPQTMRTISLLAMMSALVLNLDLLKGALRACKKIQLMYEFELGIF
jgi:hypothetical protein